MRFLLNEVRAQRSYPALQEALAGPPRAVFAEGLCAGLGAPLCAALCEDLSRPLVFFAPDEGEALAAARALAGFFGRVLVYGARDAQLSPSDTHSESLGAARLSVLCALLSGDFDAVVTTPEAACQSTLPPEELRALARPLARGARLSPEALCAALAALGYTFAARVEGRGQFSRRGGIVDFFAPTGDAPLRAEFFGDEIERLQWFDAFSQRSTGDAGACTLVPATELFLTERARDEALSLVEKARGAPRLSEEQRAFLEAQKHALENGESGAADALFPLVYPRADLFSYLPDALCFVLSYPRCESALEAAQDAFSQTLSAYAASGLFALGRDFAFLRECASFLEALRARRCVFSSPLDAGTSFAGDLFSFHARSSPQFGENRAVLLSLVSELCAADFRVVLLAQSAFAAQNLALLLAEGGIPARCDSPDDTPPQARQVLVFSEADADGRALFCAGFELPDTRFCLLSETAALSPLAPAARRRRAAAVSAKERIFSYTDLHIGDYVVHESYGIGVFEGLCPIASGGVTRDFLKIRYAGTDVLYVPCSNLAPVFKYVGKGADGTVALSHMGAAAWRETKKRAKSAVAEIAKDLARLYAERNRAQGFSFSPDSPWQAQFEDAFEFDETPGQLRAAGEVKRDMERSRPMDRLLCGDVGFGKTEVALRGVFKCVMDGKQAAILAPTTLLAMQHYRTVLARFRGYPVRVSLLSRFCTKKEIAACLLALKSGACDIVVGTHRLLQKDVCFHDLGFLVVDEEQRFGVTHKERLKALSKNVDVLTLTATPIPRTLNMALGGVRDLSLLEEAFGDRQPVQTVVCAYDEAVVLGAIRRELRRAGQVFYLVNRIERLAQRAQFLIDRLPGARVRVAHGRQDKEELSSLWQDLVAGEIDILVCTTLIETGIDLPGANTLIVEHAERLGLSQLHQLRGRVGRSFRKAYAYFTYPAGRALSEVAEKRLSAIREYARFGAGFQLAMRDLELRGAGTLLGAQQSGHMERVGYDLYLKLLEQAVSEERGEPEKTGEDCFIDLPIPARLSEDYVPDSTDRILFYKKFSALSSSEEEEPLRAELCDRFGPLPAAAENLFAVARLRREAQACGFVKLSFSEGVLRFFAPRFHDGAVTLLAAVYGKAFFVSSGEHPRLNLKCTQKEAADTARALLLHYREFCAQSS